MIKQREAKYIEKIALERGGHVEKRRVVKIVDTEKLLHKNEQKRICLGLPVGRLITVKDGQSVWTPPPKRLRQYNEKI